MTGSTFGLEIRIEFQYPNRGCFWSLEILEFGISVFLPEPSEWVSPNKKQFASSEYTQMLDLSRTRTNDGPKKMSHQNELSRREPNHLVWLPIQTRNQN